MEDSTKLQLEGLLQARSEDMRHGRGPRRRAQAQELVLEAERLGYDSVWTAEAYGSDVLTPLAWWGSRTERIRLGTALFQMSARKPTATSTSFKSSGF